MIRNTYFHCLLLYSLIVSTVDSHSKIFGLAPQYSMFYESNIDFKCLDSAHLIIPFSYVNDDYCDCEDGSDEPGTAACNEAWFHCENSGYIDAMDIPSSRVDDGICDCCDGTDEVFNDKITCNNTCEQLSSTEASEADSEIEKTLETGRVIKAQLVKSGTQKINKLLSKITDLSNTRYEMEKFVLQKEKIYHEWKEERERATNAYREIKRQEIKHEENLRQYRNEAINYFMGYDANNDGLISIDEIKHSKLFDTNNDGIVSESEAKHYFHGEEYINLEYFLSKTWQLLKPFKVDINELDKIVDSIDENELLVLGEESSDRVREKQYLLKSAKSLDKYKHDSHKIWKKMRDVEYEFLREQHNLTLIDAEIQKIQEYLTRDFGKHNEFLEFENKCIYNEESEYSYRFCFYGAMTQYEKGDRSKKPIIIGYFEKWAGDKENIYSAMRYSNGTACWHGHKRVATVKLRCGDVNEIAAVIEPYPCKYEVDLVTPAACEYKNEHDEL